LEIFRANLSLATHSETNCNSLLSVAVISVAEIADVYSVESSAYIYTLALFKARGMSLVKILKSKRSGQLPRGIPDYTWIMLEASIKEHPLFCYKKIFIHSIAGVVKPKRAFFPISRLRSLMSKAALKSINHQSLSATHQSSGAVV
jgi:hypothetical protein